MPAHPPRKKDYREHVGNLVHAALEAAAPGAAVGREWPRDLEQGRWWVIAAGKAAAAMLDETRKRLGERCRRSLSVVVGGSGGGCGGMGGRHEIVEGDHPLPTERNVAGARRVQEFVLEARGAFASGEIAGMVVLLSGGASALLTLPAEGVSLEDLRRVTDALLAAGAPIGALNCVRKHLEVLKGGGVARLAAGPASMPVWTLVLSDVIGDDLGTIGSGPTAADETTYAEALEVMRRYGALGVSPAATHHLREGAAGRRGETVKPGDAALACVRHRIIASNTAAVRAVAARAKELGFEVAGMKDGVTGEAREAGRRLGREIAGLRGEGGGAACIVWGGETTVTVTGDGRGGRNQELALSAAVEIAGETGVVVAAFATDGIDGPTDAAGAVVTGESIGLGLNAGLDGAAYLARNDSHSFLGATGALIRTGATGTNVNDVSVGLVYGEEG